MSRETMCASCSHNGVCKYKKDYLDMIEVLTEKFENFSTIEDKSFMSFHDPVCRYHCEKKLYVPGYREAERSDEVKETLIKMRGTM